MNFFSESGYHWDSFYAFDTQDLKFLSFPAIFLEENKIKEKYFEKFVGAPKMLSINPSTAQNQNGRLILHKIIVKDFKSYYGTHTIGPFHHSFTSVVGPNGSGKSNIIDALMFVLGYRARRMRQAKLTELIHFSEKSPDCDSTTVTLCFEQVDEQGQLFPNNGTGLTISRTVYKSNRSTYTMNNQLVKFEEVEMVLKKIGIDLDHERFLILQGEVESIALMKPKGTTESQEGLLEYLEDIIGSNTYIPQIDQTGKQVDKLSEECSEKLLKLRVCEKDLQNLEPERLEAEDFLIQENNLAYAKAELYSVLKYKANKFVNEAIASLNDLKTSLEKEQKKSERQINEAEAIDQEIKQQTDQITLIEKEASEALKKLLSIEQEDIRLQESRKHLKNKLKSLSKSSEDDLKVRGEIDRQIGNLENEAKLLLEELMNMEETLKKNEGELSVLAEGLKSKNGNLQKEQEKVQSQMRCPMEQQLQLQSSLNLELASLDSLKTKLTEDEGKLTELEESLVKCQEDLKTLEEEKQELVEVQNQAFRGKSRCESETKQIEASICLGSKDINGLEQTINEANAVLSESASDDSLLASLMKESSQQRIKGIHGRLGELGSINDKFDVAISTSCASLNHIVVDTTACAQKCIEFLRSNRLGRASFIVLDKMKPPTKSADIPSGSQRLFDLVQCNEKYKSVFHYAIGDTLVAKDLDEATKFAYSGPKRFRVVTLDGKLIDIAGTMTGGGAKPKKGAMKRSVPEVSRDQVEKLEQIVSAKRQELSSLKGKLSKLQDQQRGFEKQLSESEFNLTKIDISITSLNSQISSLHEQIEQAKKAKLNKKEFSGLQAEIQSHEKEIAKIQKDLDKVKATLMPFELKLKEVEEKLMQAGGLAYRAKLSVVKDQKDQIALKKGRLAKVDAEMQTAARRLQDLDSSGNAKNDVKEHESKRIQDEIKEIDAHLKKKTQEAFSIKQLTDKLTEKVEEHKEVLESLREKQEETTRALSKFRKLEVLCFFLIY